MQHVLSFYVTSVKTVPNHALVHQISLSNTAENLLVGTAKRVITPTLETLEDIDENRLLDPCKIFDDANGNGSRDVVWVAGFGNGHAANGVHDQRLGRVQVCG